ncbi:Gaa1p [Sugiyamaella lignohabitans]|uniref:Gaa1p n=1 Tax=Sugiyamaella lignohabitans TaxID=796027 RepID=A0A161HFL6_9ASCO|nr:Gaa1p [Sugiyamaella lignohabitans]ANB11351.1 Gaa1p [Sugiyamaella lignohabitans]
MGIFENLQRRAAKSGLAPKLIASLRYLSLIAALAGIVWLLVLPIDGQYRKTYISENALLPAQARTYFRESEWNIVRGYREEVNMLETASPEQRSQAIVEWMDDIGLKTSVHHWEVAHPGHKNESLSGTNVYGILHSPRGGHAEAMVLTAPWINKDYQFNGGGVALVVALARYFHKWSIWSKNIIFVVSSDSQFSLRSWISAYHTSLPNTAGSIEGAVVLDYPDKSDYLDSVEIFYEGLNGQLPNLDLINTAVIISNHEGLKVFIQGMISAGFNIYKERVQTLFRGILAQLVAGIGPGPGSENFSGWRIDSITLRARGTAGPMDITTFGRIAESLFRSINNLLEHFHQSFFFYFLLSPRKFVSIGTYLPAAMLLANSFLLIAVYNLVMTTKRDFQTIIFVPGIILAVVVATSQLFGYVSLLIESKSVFPFVISGGVVFSLGVPSAIKLLTGKNTFSVSTLLSLHSLTMILYSLFLTTLSTLNFSLSFCLGLVTIPLAWIRPGMPLYKSIILLTISSPWVGLVILSAIKELPPHELILSLVWAWRGLQVWTWGIITGIWLPVWLVCVVVASAPTPAPAPQTEKKAS